MNKLLIILSFFFCFSSFAYDLHSVGFIPEEVHSFNVDYVPNNGLGASFDIYLKGSVIKTTC